DANLDYIAARCLSGAEQDAAFADGRKRWPANAWFAYAAGYTQAEAAHWDDARQALTVAMAGLPGFSDGIAVDLARIQRFQGGTDAQAMTTLATHSEELR